MSFLTKLIKVVLNFAKFETSLGGASAYLPVNSKVAQEVDDLTHMATQIVTIATALEAAGTPDKLLLAAAPVIAQVLHNSEIMQSKKIIDQKLFELSCNEYAQATADLLKSIGE